MAKSCPVTHTLSCDVSPETCCNAFKICASVSLERINAAYLLKSLTESGGINNSEWNKAKSDYITSSEDEKEQKKLAKQTDIFLPIPDSDIVDAASVKDFNDNLR